MSSSEQHDSGGGRRSLRDAVAAARTNQADRRDVIVELNAAETGRLELLLKEVEPVLAELPPEADQFQCALVAGDPPRLWFDMISYVAMGPDKRTYRFVTDSRTGRAVRLETEEVGAMADFVTEYLAYRLIEREGALEAAPRAVAAGESRNSVGLAVILAFLAGACIGVLGLFVLALVVSAP